MMIECIMKRNVKVDLLVETANTNNRIIYMTPSKGKHDNTIAFPRRHAEHELNTNYVNAKTKRKMKKTTQNMLAFFIQKQEQKNVRDGYDNEGKNNATERNNMVKPIQNNVLDEYDAKLVYLGRRNSSNSYEIVQVCDDDMTNSSSADNSNTNNADIAATCSDIPSQHYVVVSSVAIVKKIHPTRVGTMIPSLSSGTLYAIYDTTTNDDEYNVVVVDDENDSIGFDDTYNYNDDDKHPYNCKNSFVVDTVEANKRMIGLIWYKVPSMWNIIRNASLLARQVQYAIVGQCNVNSDEKKSSSSFKSKIDKNEQQTHFLDEEMCLQQIKQNGCLKGLLQQYPVEGNTCSSTTRGDRLIQLYENQIPYTTNTTSTTAATTTTNDEQRNMKKKKKNTNRLKNRLNFHGRGRIASSKNVQLVRVCLGEEEDVANFDACRVTAQQPQTPYRNTNDSLPNHVDTKMSCTTPTVICQMAKWDTDTFHVDFHTPSSTHVTSSQQQQSQNEDFTQQQQQSQEGDGCRNPPPTYFTALHAFAFGIAQLDL